VSASAATQQAALPDLERLTAGLTAVLGRAAESDGVTVLHRERNPHAGSFSSEIVTCRLRDGAEVRVFCKYGTEQQDDPERGRGGVAYEATVYRRVLERSEAFAPRLYGCYVDPETKGTWLVLEHLENFVRSREGPTPYSGLILGAAWIGRFQTVWEQRLAAGDRPPLRTYDLDYYRRWSRRTAELADDLHGRHPWLEDACRRYDEAVELLFERPPTVIHGDYYTSNLLICDGTIAAVDWGAAAIGPGEIDLAGLVGRWRPEAAEEAKRQYRQARWGDDEPPGFEQTLDVATLYLCFRWMGESRAWLVDERRRWRFDVARATAERLGLI
jgi:hypothetical protein